MAGKDIQLTHIQKLIGRRMLESKVAKPCFYLAADADVTELMALRPKLRKSLGIKITTNTFYVRTLAMAVKKYPLMAGVIEADTIKIAEQINVGFAVTAPQGLVVPVIKEADKKDLAEIARQEKILTEKTRDNKLTLEDVQGETIALSNLGAYDIDSFIAIVPPPVSTILAIGNVNRVAGIEDGRPAIRKKVSLSLAVDHRVINGDYAAKFLSFITEQLQNPQSLIS